MDIRTVTSAEYAALWDFLYLAIFVPEGAEPLPRSVIDKLEIAVYVEGFGDRRGDLGVVAYIDGRIVGAAWTRIINAFGHIDDGTPELAIAVLPEYRNHGIGGKLLDALFTELAGAGFAKTSLSVQKENPALRLYKRAGYNIVRDDGDDYVMVRELTR